MSSNLAEDFSATQLPMEEIASEVASVLMRRLKTGTSGGDILKLLQIVLLTGDEAAEFLRVKPKTISTWISKGLILVRYVNSEPRFLLSELLAWTLPEDDKHSQYRLSVAAGCRIATRRLAAVAERGEN